MSATFSRYAQPETIAKILAAAKRRQLLSLKARNRAKELRDRMTAAERNPLRFNKLPNGDYELDESYPVAPDPYPLRYTRKRKARDLDTL